MRFCMRMQYLELVFGDMRTLACKAPLHYGVASVLSILHIYICMRNCELAAYEGEALSSHRGG